MHLRHGKRPNVSENDSDESENVSDEKENRPRSKKKILVKKASKENVKRTPNKETENVNKKRKTSVADVFTSEESGSDSVSDMLANETPVATSSKPSTSATPVEDVELSSDDGGIHQYGRGFKVVDTQKKKKAEAKKKEDKKKKEQVANDLMEDEDIERGKKKSNKAIHAAVKKSTAAAAKKSAAAAKKSAATKKATKSKTARAQIVSTPVLGRTLNTEQEQVCLVTYL